MSEAITYTWTSERRAEGYFVSETPSRGDTLVFGPIADLATLRAFLGARKRIVSENVLVTLANARKRTYSAKAWKVSDGGPVRPRF